MTDYVILHLQEDGSFAVIPGSAIKASSARRALAAAEVKEGQYVAIPLRSWKPLTVKVEQTTKTTIS